MDEIIVKTFECAKVREAGAAATTTAAAGGGGGNNVAPNVSANANAVTLRTQDVEAGFKTVLLGSLGDHGLSQVLLFVEAFNKRTQMNWTAAPALAATQKSSNGTSGGAPI